MALAPGVLFVVPTGATAAEYVWLEGESARCNLEPQIAGWGNQHDLSDGKWLHDSIPEGGVPKKVPEGGIVLVYAFKADAAAPHETCAHVQLVDQTRSLDALPSIEPTGAEREAATATGTDDATHDPTDGQPAHSAYSACRLPGTPLPAITCQDEVLGNTRRKERASRARVATCQGLSLPDNGAPGRIRTCNPRIRSPRLYPLSYGRKCFEYRTL